MKEKNGLMEDKGKTRFRWPGAHLPDTGELEYVVS